MTTIRFPSPPKRRVLVADNSPTLLHLVTGILEREGYSAIIACDGREAFRILRSDCDFVAAIFATGMPHLTGSDLVNYMRTEKRLMRIPVMFMASAQDSLRRSQDLSSGAAILLPKPFTADQLRLMLGVLECNRWSAPRRSAA